MRFLIHKWSTSLAGSAQSSISPYACGKEISEIGHTDYGWVATAVLNFPDGGLEQSRQKAGIDIMRLVVVSNRLPFTVSFHEGTPQFKPSAGG
jgi:hypothetical protein